ncbi:polysaccharide deacetylase family protein [Sedimenticola hydrogenitrophicus]|uniref:polysaccharide deacetylase family protein n=1 Tax=Sedimenticola hydrogenitrophicus TaxID=2967975 RepID=UPI0021A4C7BC|nr:polysaccharide deacetylase family protein [Sedimenticola hydrogenitrophicus]
MRLSLRIEVGSEKGALEGVPALLRLLDEHQVKASFFFSLGPDYTRYPFAHLIPTLIRQRLPVSYIGRRCRDNLLAVANAGHDIGLSSFTALDWQRDVAFRTAVWTHNEVARAVENFTGLFGREPRYYAARGWQVNPHLLTEEEGFGFEFASDVRGHHIFLPELQGALSRCPQIPTTLPTLDELLSQEEINQDNLHQYLYAACQRIMPNGEVFSLSAEREGGELLEVFERLLVMWKGGQWEIRSMSELFGRIGEAPLKRHRIGWGTVAGETRHLAMQSSAL